MKHVLKSKTMWLGLALLVLPHVEDFVALLQEHEASAWVISLAGALAMLLRCVTNEAVTMSPVQDVMATAVEDVTKTSLLVICLFSLMAGCAATCDNVVIKRELWPDGGAGAQTITYECGSSTITHRVKKPPACLDACFKPEGTDGR